ncbi:SpoVR family protein [candidate division KSB1 bacterium]|nr:MAG: SpoVR family protein [candidate division KSB1 bacterium]MBC6949586.1 SpoVR family protein [candidate division KSB1 bacterium]MCE7943803.1 SpoVR family protein [Chlorobi bacterium CHB1]MDL1874947.1 SpoVR family protein [Cytophagia bacterium CHB2]
MSLPSNLSAIKDEIRGYAWEYGLDFYETIFEVIEYDELNEIASYGGFPTRYPHWRYGMEYEELSKSYSYGLSKIYEMVINNNPCYAYLMHCNNLVDQKLVMAHVYAHCDFFKNNLWFSKTNRKMMDEMANHATRVRRYLEQFGEEQVENFIDVCLSLENLIDPHLPFMGGENGQAPVMEEEKPDEPKQHKFKSPKDYLEEFINPPSFIEEQRKREEEESKKRFRKVPERPQRDVLQFLIEYAPLQKWQRDVLSIIREEAYYFAPQGQTKIMNEGWASYWHSKMMTERILNDSEVIDYADHHSGTLFTSPGRLNPYKLGIELFRDIEERWNKGKFGKEYEECDDYSTKKNWDKQAGLGRQKIFEVRKLYNDVTFIDAFLTPEFCREHKMFVYDYNERNGYYEISDREFHMVKQRLLFMLTNHGQPFITVEDGNYRNRGELYLVHRHEGIDLKLDEARDTMRNLYTVWTRPIHLETMLDESRTLLTFDGEQHKETELD